MLWGGTKGEDETGQTELSDEERQKLFKERKELEMKLDQMAKDGIGIGNLKRSPFIERCCEIERTLGRRNAEMLSELKDRRRERRFYFKSVVKENERIIYGNTYLKRLDSEKEFRGLFVPLEDIIEKGRKILRDEYKERIDFYRTLRTQAEKIEDIFLRNATCKLLEDVERGAEKILCRIDLYFENKEDLLGSKNVYFLKFNKREFDNIHEPNEKVSTEEKFIKEINDFVRILTQEITNEISRDLIVGDGQVLLMSFFANLQGLKGGSEIVQIPYELPKPEVGRPTVKKN